MSAGAQTQPGEGFLRLLMVLPVICYQCSKLALRAHKDLGAELSIFAAFSVLVQESERPKRGAQSRSDLRLGAGNRLAAFFVESNDSGHSETIGPPSHPNVSPEVQQTAFWAVGSTGHRNTLNECRPASDWT